MSLMRSLPNWPDHITDEVRAIVREFPRMAAFTVALELHVRTGYEVSGEEVYLWMLHENHR